MGSPLSLRAPPAAAPPAAAPPAAATAAAATAAAATAADDGALVAAKHTALEFDATLPPLNSYMLNGIDYKQLKRIKSSSLQEIARWGAGQGRAVTGAAASSAAQHSAALIGCCCMSQA